MVVFVAIVLRTFFIWVTTGAEYQSSTYVAKHIMLPICILNVIIYVFMPLVATWDWSRTHFATMMPETTLKGGVYPDFNSNWFFDAGSMII